MQFYTSNQMRGRKRNPPYPFVVLTRDNSDDFGYKTAFKVQIYLSLEQVVDAGTTKILKIGQDGGQTPLPVRPFPQLGDNYCSLGSSMDYYEAIYNLGATLREEYLNGLRDVAWDEERRARFEGLDGFDMSLLRFSGSERLIDDASSFLKQSNRNKPQKRTQLNFKFRTPMTDSGPRLEAKFDFTRKRRLPNRINAVIGYNGTGKTKLLSNLAVAASEYGYDSKEQRRDRVFGRFIGKKPRFSRVVVVSYSAFDSFVIPDEEEAERVGYIYCGLRMNVPPLDGKPREPVYGLKNPEAIELDFVNAFSRIELQNRVQNLRNALRPLLDDGSFNKIGFSGLYPDFSQSLFFDFYKRLSSGHKIVLKIIVELIAYCDGREPTLVLIDEPETHLHPPLVAAFLRSIRIVLGDLNAFAIVATHSPVVLQELPSRYVLVLRRSEVGAVSSSPKIETFGETIGVITQHVFNLDDGSTDWHETLRELSSLYSLSEIEEGLGHELGFAARSFVLSEQSEDEA